MWLRGYIVIVRACSVDRDLIDMSKKMLWEVEEAYVRFAKELNSTSPVKKRLRADEEGSGLQTPGAA